MKKHEDIDLHFYDGFLERNFTDHLAPAFEVDRRDFLKYFGAGITVLIAWPGLFGQEGAGRRGRQLPDDFNAFLKVGEDGRVTGFTGKIEMGQGVHTSLAQMLAEEMDVPVDSVDLIMGDTDLCPWDMGTFGSMTTRFFGPPFRAAAAEAKAVLVELAAEKLGVPGQNLKTRDGYVYEEMSGKRVSYADLTRGKTVLKRLEGKAQPEAPDQFTLVGKPMLRRDARAKVTGTARYAGDIVFPGMLCAKILRPPAHGARLISADLSEARQLEGVHVVEDGDLIAVLHERPDIAGEALTKVRAEFERPATGLDDKNIFEHLLKVAPEGEAVAQGGNLPEGEAAAKIIVEETYLDSYTAHAPIEPHTAVAKMEGEKLTIWASTQTPFRLKEEAAQAVGLPADSVRVVPPFVGGGFGGKTANRQAVEAARLARSTGRPVQVAWTRAEEFFYDTFRPAAIVKIRSGVTESGTISFWDYGVYFAGQRGAEHFYSVPHHRTTVFGSGWVGPPGSHPFATGAWRAPSNNTNTFARESHVDILAARAGVDPVSFRLKNLTDPRMRRVLEAAADKFGWSPARSPSGRGIGVALGIDAGTYVAHLAQVSIDEETGEVRVKRVVCAQEMGLCINPEGSRIQMEGCITMGMGYALAEEIHFQDGEVLDLNFNTYQIPRFSWVPEIETVILDAQNSPPQGGGEPAIICMGAVLTNAVFDACGARLLRLPMTPERVKAAIKRAKA